MVGLTCPRCDKQLNKQADNSDACVACGISFPRLDGSVPFVWAEPGYALSDWRNRFNAALADIEAQIASTNTKNAPQPTTQKRLAQLNTAWRRYMEELQSLLAPLKVGEAIAKETHLALRTQLPSHHGVLSYAQNIHRDWCWGVQENTAVLEHLGQAFQRDGQPGVERMLVLGCGAGRLAYDLHRLFECTETWALDANPLLCLIGDAMSKGATKHLTEFPLAPVKLEDVCVERTLSAPTTTEGLHFICADAMRAPFAAGSFDVLVTPWLIDVVDTSLNDMLGEIYRLLSPGGTWINHGSMAFAGENALNCLTAPEVAEMAADRGFNVVWQEDVELPYLQSPASRQARVETTHTLIAKRDDERSQARTPRHQHLPEWITAGNQAVPLTPGFQTQITTQRIHAFIMTLIDGKRSVRDMAKVMEEQRLMPAADAVPAIRKFLTTMYEEESKAQGRASQ